MVHKYIRKFQNSTLLEGKIGVSIFDELLNQYIFMIENFIYKS